MSETNHFMKNINLLTKYGIILLGVIYPVMNKTSVQYVLMCILVFFTIVDIAYNAKKFVRVETFIGILFVMSFLISICINKWTITNCVELINTFMVFTNLINVNDNWDNKKSVRVLIIIYIVTTAIVAFIDLAMYISYYEGSYWLNDHYEYLGVKDGRLWGLFNANISAFLAITSLTLTIVIFLKTEKCRELMIVNIILQAHILIYSQSRSVWIIIASVVTAFIYTSPKLKVNNIFIKFLCGIIVTVLLYGGAHIYNEASGYIPRAMMNIKIEKAILSNINKMQKFDIHNMEKDDISVERNIEEGHISQGRVGLWSGTFKIIKKSPILGNSLTPFREDADKNFDEYWVSIVRNAGIHNVYIMIIGVSGLLGLFIFMMFVLWTYFKFIKYIFNPKGERHVKILMAFSLSMFIEEMIESRMLYMMNYYIVVVFMIIGYCYYKCRNVSKLVSG